MKKEMLLINNIPSVIWGEKSEKVIVAVHGNMSNKEDVPIEILAQKAVPKGYQILSFDLPEHGGRKNENTPCKVQYCVKDLTDIMTYAKDRWSSISLFANSMGAYFSLLSYCNEALERAWFLSPLVDMQRMIENMMTWFNVTEEQLKSEQTISTPMGQTLYWDYYCYVKEHPVRKWDTPTYILYGDKDEQCERDTVYGFAERFSCKLQLAEGAEHWFHTPEQLALMKEWLDTTV